MESLTVKREVVIPGELLGEKGLKPGAGTYSEGGRIYAAQLGIRSERSGFVSVIPLGGRYIPRSGDAVIGKVEDIGPSHWLIEINSPYPAPLHVNESPWKVEFGDTARYLKVGDVVLASVLSVDETKRVQLTMKERGLRRLTGGQIVEISHSKVPRVIGKRGSMISLIKRYTQCRIFVGQNGRIWVDGDPKDIVNVVRVLRLIEEQAQVLGLTEKVKELLEQLYGKNA